MFFTYGEYARIGNSHQMLLFTFSNENTVKFGERFDFYAGDLSIVGKLDVLFFACFHGEIIHFTIDQHLVFAVPQGLRILIAMGIHEAEEFPRVAFDGHLPDILADAVLENRDLPVVVEGGKVALVNGSLVQVEIKTNRQRGLWINDDLGHIVHLEDVFVGAVSLGDHPETDQFAAVFRYGFGGNGGPGEWKAHPVDLVFNDFARNEAG